MYIFPVLLCFFFPIILFPFGWFSFVIFTAGPLQLREVFGKNVFLLIATKNKPECRNETSFSLLPFSWGFNFVLSAWHGQCWGYFARLYSKMTVYTTPPPLPQQKNKIQYNKNKQYILPITLATAYTYGACYIRAG